MLASRRSRAGAAGRAADPGCRSLAYDRRRDTAMSAWVADRERFQLYVTAGVIPAEAWTPLEEAQRIVEQANALLRQAEAEREQIFAQARHEGLIEGREAGLRECADDIAIGVVKHIAPAIGAERLVASLVAEAMQKLVFEPHLLVRIHPDVVAQARSEVAALGAAAA